MTDLGGPQDGRPLELEGPRAEATVLHVDMDAFFVAVEVLAEPSLAGRPVVVGGTGARGVVASASYEARVFGIHSAMPSSRARRLCPEAVFIPGHYERYADYSRRIHEIFGRFTPLVEGIALDEAFLDVGGARRLFGSPTQIARDIRRLVKGELSLTASVGVARSKLMAKLASEGAKPIANHTGVKPGLGVVVIRPDQELAYLHPLPATALWGVGPATAARLRRIGVLTVGDLARVPMSTLTAAVGTASGEQLRRLSWGQDPRPVVADREAKSVGHEQTYPVDQHRRDELQREVVSLADSVATRLRANGLAGRTVTLKVRFGDFTTITRSQTVPSATATGADVARVAGVLLDGVDLQGGDRLLGVSVSNLTQGAPQQLALDDAAAVGRWERATQAMDAVRLRFGSSALGPTSLLAESGLQLRRPGHLQWGPEAVDTENKTRLG